MCHCPNTFGAHCIITPHVNVCQPQVPSQVASLGKALGAPGAAGGPLTRVDAVVAPQVSRLGEGLTAPVTGVGLLVLEVEVEAGRLAETLPTAGAAVWASLLVVGGGEVVTLVIWQHLVLGPRICFICLLVMYGCVMELRDVHIWKVFEASVA